MPVERSQIADAVTQRQTEKLRIQSNDTAAVSIVQGRVQTATLPDAETVAISHGLGRRPDGFILIGLTGATTAGFILTIGRDQRELRDRIVRRGNWRTNPLLESDGPGHHLLPLPNRRAWNHDLRGILCRRGGSAIGAARKRGVTELTRITGAGRREATAQGDLGLHAGGKGVDCGDCVVWLQELA